jgi:hypothetical protein
VYTLLLLTMDRIGQVIVTGGQVIVTGAVGLNGATGAVGAYETCHFKKVQRGTNVEKTK